MNSACLKGFLILKTKKTVGFNNTRSSTNRTQKKVLETKKKQQTKRKKRNPNVQNVAFLSFFSQTWCRVKLCRAYHFIFVTSQRKEFNNNLQRTQQDFNGKNQMHFVSFFSSSSSFFQTVKKGINNTAAARRHTKRTFFISPFFMTGRFVLCSRR